MLYNINLDKSKKAELKSITGSTYIPYIDIEGITMTGYSKRKIDDAIKRRRSL